MLTYSLQTHELMDFLLWSIPWDSPQQDRFLCGFLGFFWRDRNHKCYKQFRQSEMARKPLENNSGQLTTTGKSVRLISLKYQQVLFFLCLLFSWLKWQDVGVLGHTQPESLFCFSQNLDPYQYHSGHHPPTWSPLEGNLTIYESGN